VRKKTRRLHAVIIPIRRRDCAPPGVNWKRPQCDLWRSAKTNPTESFCQIVATMRPRAPKPSASSSCESFCPTVTANRADSNPIPLCPTVATFVAAPPMMGHKVVLAAPSLRRPTASLLAVTTRGCTFMLCSLATLIQLSPR
jgi:hypothetical protein